MDEETENVTNDAEMPKKLAEAWANALVKLHSKTVKQAKKHSSKMEETESCASNSDTQLC